MPPHHLPHPRWSTSTETTTLPTRREGRGRQLSSLPLLGNRSKSCSTSIDERVFRLSSDTLPCSSATSDPVRLTTMPDVLYVETWDALPVLIISAWPNIKTARCPRPSPVNGYELLKPLSITGLEVPAKSLFVDSCSVLYTSVGDPVLAATSTISRYTCNAMLAATLLPGPVGITCLAFFRRSRRLSLLSYRDIWIAARRRTYPSRMDERLVRGEQGHPVVASP
ncbi:hypothetical protein F5883DRAFT_566923 [Diaporthe sp. PMI_573]|nr:hypothetical protein F5883DRAFT_566923 [Diaporthaceae sp. PMI_573]